MSDVQTLQEKINYDKTFDCVQCGYCLPACPTYETMERETHSPRGRINLVKLVAEGKASIKDLQEPIEKCLGCMACTTVCPTNVQYGQILEGAKEVIEDHQVKSVWQKKTEDFLFESFFPSGKWMNTLGNLTWFYQRTGLQAFANLLSLTKLAPLHLDQFEQVIPVQPSPKERAKRAKRYMRKRPATAKVAFFTGCVMDSVFFETNQNTIELLLRSGLEVVLPEQQTCCGALHAHSGKINDSRELAKRNIEAFEEEKADYIVNNAGGCGARLIEYHHLFEEGTSWHERAKQFVSKVKDISEVLVEVDELEFTTPIDYTVTYQPSCHMTNVQGVKSPPLELIRKIPGITLKELDRPDFCCGSAGIYNIINYEESMDILDVKMKDVCRIDPGSIVTTNPGCLLQMKLGIEREKVSDGMEAVHLVDLLMEASPVARQDGPRQTPFQKGSE
ncbi:(Fe-S)-binding protein [Halobacillus shinanisalinarum]|uniref:Glycolate oxidase iron-sulfur subunit n=1 Tax=Halobacillus shinanisalinarum TaxID=2932258 RepID=A0ABY4GWR4_9BACI|nr:(Fe-S)-binding protein [Halobacillus shinanisalinarum]UOQ92384.1 (Fe-S)-binding protein [Halobacillus shinanisalinarum]